MSTDLATLIGSRICHDLISPIGAIGNGVELLAMTGSAGDVSPELDLISQSVENANARIRYFRISFGATSSSQIMGRQEVLSVLSASAPQRKEGVSTTFGKSKPINRARKSRSRFL